MTSTYMPFGKYRNCALENIPVTYLQWALHNADRMDYWLRDAMQRELARRSGGQSSSSYTAQHIPAAVSLETALQLVAEGRRGLARKNHPDLGGDVFKMTEANATADFLQDALRELFAGVRR